MQNLPGFHQSVAVSTELNGNASPTHARVDRETTHKLPGLDNDPQNAALLVWSAADAAALERLSKFYEAYCREKIVCNGLKLEQLAYTLSRRRTKLPWRSYAVVDHARSTHFQATTPTRASTDPKAIAFVFTGQGAQYAGMGMELMQYPTFKNNMVKSDSILADLGCSWSVFG
jgi:acyl transferase domain-containing protein